MLKTISLDDFFRAGGTDLPTLVAKVDASVGLCDDDFLLVVGSLAEGLGTSKSDLDLLLLTSRDEHLLPPQDEIALVAGRCLADMRILRLTYVDDLLARLDGWSRLPWDVTHAVKLTKEERVLLHRLIHGQLVLHSDHSDLDAVPRPSLQAVARLKLHVARQLSRTVQVDMIGNRDSGDYRSLVFAAQDLLGHAVDALLAGYYLTNPLPKWRSRLLDFLPADWESSLSIRPSGMTAGELVWLLHRTPEAPEVGPALEHALRITTFARAVFVWAERCLLQGLPQEPAVPAVWPQLERRATDRPLPHLDLNVDFQFADGGVAVARLNDFSETLRLSAREFALTLLFDGTTTAREAEAVVYASHGPGPGLADRLALRLVAANMSVE